MAHPEQQAFCEYVRARFPEHFVDAHVLDVGSLDINGNNRGLFAGGTYLGIDLGHGPGVDRVAHVTELEPRDPILRPAYDVVISTEALEHDARWADSLRAMVALLRPGGLLVITCASTGRAEHGTHAARPEDSPHTCDHYQNLTERDFRSAWDVDAVFSAHSFTFAPASCDLYFWGIKA